MLTEINITDYLSEDDIKELCIQHVHQLIRKGGERLISNLAYEVAYKILDSAIDEESMTTIRNKAKEILQKDSSYNIFRPKDAWGSEDSPAYKTLKSAMEENSQLIKDKVKETILKYDYESQIRKNPEFFAEALVDALKLGFTKNEG